MDDAVRKLFEFANKGSGWVFSGFVEWVMGLRRSTIFAASRELFVFCSFVCSCRLVFRCFVNFFQI